MRFKDFIVEKSLFCSGDNLEINGLKYCGGDLSDGEEIFFHAFNPLNVDFFTDGQGNTRGFYMEIREINDCIDIGKNFSRYKIEPVLLKILTFFYIRYTNIIMYSIYKVQNKEVI